MPINFLDSPAEIKAFLKEVNGVYICGDSHRAIANDRYQQSFNAIMDFVVDSNKNKGEYFPMFMMGKSAQSFVKKLGLSHSVLQNMKNFHNSNIKVELLKNHDDTFLFH